VGNYRTDLILAAKDMGAAGTETFDIKFKKPISRIELTYKTTRASLTMAAPAPANIPKIELIDGSKPLHSLTGYSNQALAYYSRPGRIMDHGQHIMTQSEYDIYAIDFGRYLWDPLLAFDPTRFSNPQLKVTWDEDVADTSVTANAMEITAELFDEKLPSPIGFLSARSIWSGNFLADNSVNEVMLPEDEVIRQILMRSHYDGYEPWYQIDIAKLDEAGSGAVIFDHTDLELYYRRMKSRWPVIVIPLATHAYATASVFYIPQSDYWAGINLNPVAATAEYYITNASAKGGKVSVIGSADTNCVGEAHGFLPWSTWQFPMGNPNEPDDWYNPAGKKPRLRLTSNSAGVSGDGDVVVETVHKY